MSDEDLVRRLRNTTIAIQPIFPTMRHEAADAIERLMREREWLKRERDEYYADREHFTKLAFVDLGANPPVAWKDRAEAAETKVAKLREALKPFVDAYENTIACDDDKWRDKDSLWESAAAMALCAGDLRRARAVLQETE